MAFSTHTERRHLADVERHLATADTCIDARIELLQRMPIFGGISGPTSSNSCSACARS